MSTPLTTLDFLFISLAVGALVLSIVLAVLAINATLLIKDVRRISSVTGEVVENFHGMIMKPINLASKIADTVAPHIEDFAKEQAGKFSKKKKKKKKS